MYSVYYYIIDRENPMGNQ